MTLEVVGAIAIVSMVWNIYNLIKICNLEDKVDFQKGQIEALLLSIPAQANTKYNVLGKR